MNRHGWAVAAAAIVASACMSTKADLRRLEGQLAYLEKRLETTEDLATEISGAAREEVVASRRETSDKLEQVRRQAAELVVRLQALEAELTALRGELTVVAQVQPGFDERLRGIDERVAGLEGATRGLREGGGESADPTQFQWSNESEGYSAARKSFEQGDLKRARLQFIELIRRWPTGRYASNAQFWLGEIQFQNRDFVNAIDKYLIVIERYPKSEKAAAAYYKMALALNELGEKERARQALEDLIAAYPNAEQLDAAKKALQSLTP